MKDKMTAKELALDFIFTLFGIFISVFSFFYFIIGYRMGLAEDIARVAAYASIFGLFFLFELKTAKKKIKLKIEKNSLDDIAVYFDGTDKVKNLLVVIASSFLVLFLPLFNQAIDTIDKIQFLFIFAAGFLRHLYIFRKRDNRDKLIYATYYDQALDKIFVFIMPFFLISVALTSGTMDEFDLAQSLLVFLIYYFWHKYLMKEK